MCTKDCICMVVAFMALTLGVVNYVNCSMCCKTSCSCVECKCCDGCEKDACCKK